MTAPVVSPWLLNAQAFAATVGLPHLRAGNHLREADSNPEWCSWIRVADLL